MHTKLYVGNLPFGTTALDLQQLFAQTGAVAAVDLVVDKFTGRSRGYAFVTMNTPEDASTAIGQLHGYSLDGRNITVNEARPPAERPTGGFDDRSRGGNRGPRRDGGGRR